MYVQVTSRCQMTCAHCLYSCSKRGKDMSIETFRKAVDASLMYDSPIAIGGGEPTLHPDLLVMLGIASFVSREPLFMVTNGTCQERLWHVLMDARSADRINVRVSSDIWHDMCMVQPWVWRDADKFGLWWGRKTATRILVRGGRAKKNWEKLLWECEQSGMEVVEDKFGCGEPRVSPDGRVWTDIPGQKSVGTINDPYVFDRVFGKIREYEERGNE